MALAISCLTEILDCLPNNLFVITSTLGEIISTEIRALGESVLMQTLFSALYTKLIETASKEVSTEATALSKSSICTTLAEAICSIDEDNKHTEGIQNLVSKAQNYVTAENIADANRFNNMEMSSNKSGHSSVASTSNNLEFIVDSSAHIADLLCGDLLKTFVGKQCAKVMTVFFRFDL